jgi:hypothetical protein
MLASPLTAAWAGYRSGCRTSYPLPTVTTAMTGGEAVAWLDAGIDHGKPSMHRSRISAVSTSVPMKIATRCQKVGSARSVECTMTL